MGYTIQPTTCYARPPCRSNRDIKILFSILGAVVVTAVVVALTVRGWQGLLNISVPTLLFTVCAAVKIVVPE